MAKRTLSLVMIVIGAALLVIAVLLPSFLVPKLRVIPLDTKSSTVTNIENGYLLDSGLLAKNEPAADRKDDPRCKDAGADKPEGDAEADKPAEMPLHCFIGETPLVSNRHVRIQEPADKKVATMEVGTVVLRDDREEPKNLVNATVDRITLDRSTAFPVVDPVSTIELNAPKAGGGEDTADIPAFTREGIQYQFPFGTTKKSFPYFDATALQTFPIDFVGEEKQDGTTVYKFTMEVEPVNLYESQKAHFTQNGRKMTEADKSSLASLRLKFPASKWGLEGDEEIEMDRYYTNVRTVRVEPNTGMIVNGTEHIFQFYARDEEEAKDIALGAGREKEKQERNRTALDFVAQWSDETKANQLEKAKESSKKMTMAGSIAPWILGIIGLLLVIFGIRMHRKS
ncbi:DUF3068 domain-containing protein [Corynebacterium sp. H78]|uniref:DUF3068 domain-containing protein n=1 Tax=Corynebacterium sp. H78 TaxID=3133417 RepID=UPI00309721BD